MCYGVRSNPWVIPFTAADVGTRETAVQDKINEAKRLRGKGWKLKRIAEEFEQATIEKQTDLAKSIAAKHQAEMTEAERLCDASHN